MKAEQTKNPFNLGAPDLFDLGWGSKIQFFFKT